MTLKDACAEYATVRRILDAFRQENASTISAYEGLKQKLEEAEDAVKKCKADVPEGGLRVFDGVEVRRVVAKEVDPAALVKVPGIANVPGVFSTSVNSKVLGAAVKAGVLREEDVEACRTVVKSDYLRVS